MGSGSRGYTLRISEHLFRLIAESLRLHSNETLKLHTLTSFVEDRVNATTTLESHELETVRDHFKAIPTKGTVSLHVSLTGACIDSLEGAQKRLSAQLGSRLIVADLISLLMFDYFVDRNVIRILQRIGLDEPSNKSDELPASDSHRENVIRLR